MILFDHTCERHSERKWEMKQEDERERENDDDHKPHISSTIPWVPNDDHYFTGQIAHDEKKSAYGFECVEI